MEKTIVTTGKTIDLAVEAALAQLGLSRDEITYEVLTLPKSGFLGFGATPAKVQVTYQAPDEVKKPEAPRSALGAASRSKPAAPAAPVKKPEEAKAEPKKEAPKPEVKKSEAPKVEPRKEAPKAPRPERKPEEAKAPKEPKVYAPAAPGSVEEKIEQFIKGLLEHMGSNAVPQAVKGEDNSYIVELVGEVLGYLIGRRGDTLDAIQHLANYSVNRGVEGHLRINVDAEDYRAKREDSLRKYARKKAQQVLKAHRRTTLEPMNAYERHVIHAALQDMENITTYSTGTEPNRRVVVEYIR